MSDIMSLEWWQTSSCLRYNRKYQCQQTSSFNWCCVTRHHSPMGVNALKILRGPPLSLFPSPPFLVTLHQLLQGPTFSWTLQIKYWGAWTPVTPHPCGVDAYAWLSRGCQWSVTTWPTKGRRGSCLPELVPFDRQTRTGEDRSPNVLCVD